MCQVHTNHFTYTISFNVQINPVREIFDSYSRDQEIVQRYSVTCSKSQGIRCRAGFKASAFNAKSKFSHFHLSVSLFYQNASNEDQLLGLESTKALPTIKRRGRGPQFKFPNPNPVDSVD